MRALPTPSADDGPGFHSNMPVSELTERDTRAIEAGVISSAPLVVISSSHRGRCHGGDVVLDLLLVLVRDAHFLHDSRASSIRRLMNSSSGAMASFLR